MAAVGRFVDQLLVENRVNATVLRRLCDDDDDGVGDEGVIQALIDDAESIVIGAAVTEYPIASLPATPEAAFVTNGGKLLQRITLDLIQGAAYDRFPEYTRNDGTTHTEQAMKLVRMVARAELRLEGLSSETANVGGETVPFDEDQEEPVRFWTGTGGTGIF